MQVSPGQEARPLQILLLQTPYGRGYWRGDRVLEKHLILYGCSYREGYEVPIVDEQMHYQNRQYKDCSGLQRYHQTKKHKGVSEYSRLQLRE